MSGSGAGGRSNKYGARRCPCNLGGTPHTHDSLRERDRHIVLHVRQLQGEITGLLVHEPRYALEVNGQHVGYYTPDYWYLIAPDQAVIEDVKSPATRKETAYRLRKRLFEACWHPLTITEIE